MDYRDKINLIVEKIETEYKGLVSVYGYVISTLDAEFRIYCKSKALLSIIKYKYFATDDEATIVFNHGSKALYDNSYCLSGMKHII